MHFPITPPRNRALSVTLRSAVVHRPRIERMDPLQRGGGLLWFHCSWPGNSLADADEELTALHEQSMRMAFSYPASFFGISFGCLRGYEIFLDRLAWIEASIRVCSKRVCTFLAFELYLSFLNERIFILNSNRGRIYSFYSRKFAV